MLGCSLPNSPSLSVSTCTSGSRRNRSSWSDHRRATQNKQQHSSPRTQWGTGRRSNLTLRRARKWRIATTAGVSIAANGRHTQAEAEKLADGLDELGHRDRLRQIGLATAFADALLVAPHRKSGHRDHRNGLELGIFLEPFGHFETGDFRQLNVHHDQIGTVLAREIERLHAVTCADGMVAVSFQQIVEELHVELIVLHDHHGLRHSDPFGLKRRTISATAGLALVSLGSVRASHVTRVTA